MLTNRRPSAWRLFALTFALVTGLAIVLGATLSAAHAAPVGALKQFRMPTDNSQPRHITVGSDGNLWFTEGADFFTPNADPETGGTFHNQIGRITPAGTITEFRVDGCQCFLNDIVQGPNGVLYVTTNSNSLVRITTAGTVQPFVETPFAVGDSLARHGDDIWITDFNSRSLWRYEIPTGEFTEFPIGANALGPHDVAVAGNGDVWFGASDISGSVEEGLIGRLVPATGTVTTFDVGAVPRSITIAPDNKVWFAARFTPQAVGFFDPATSTDTVFPANGGPQDIAAAPDGSVWFTQTTKGNIARITDEGVVTEGKVVKNSEPFGITVRPNGDPWYTMMSANKIAALQLR